MKAAYIDGGLVRLILDAGESLTLAPPRDDDPGHTLGPGTYDISPTPGLLIWDAVQAAGLDVAPAVVTRYNFLGFLALFTGAEQDAIIDSADRRVRLFCLMAAGATFVDLADPQVVGGCGLLEALGLIGAGRAAQVLAGQAPPSA